MIARKLFKDKIIRRFIFKAKVKNKETIENLYNADFEDVLMLYVDSLPLQRILQIERNLIPELKQALDKGFISKTAALGICSRLDKAEQQENERRMYFVRKTGIFV